MPTSGAFDQRVDLKTRDKIRVTCHRFQKKGHYSYECTCPTLIPHTANVVKFNVTV